MIVCQFIYLNRATILRNNFAPFGEKSFFARKGSNKPFTADLTAAKRNLERVASSSLFLNIHRLLVVTGKIL